MYTHNICYEQNMKIVKKNQLKIVIFPTVKNPCILHGRVFVINYPKSAMSPEILSSGCPTRSDTNTNWAVKPQ